MSDETVGGNALTEEVIPVNAEESEVANPPDGGGDDPNPQANANEGEHKKLGGWQRKIAKLEQQNQELVRALLDRKAEPVKEEAKPEDDVEPDPEKFETTLEYLKAVRAYDRAQIKKEIAAEQKAKEEERKAQTEQQKKKETWESRKAAARERYEDLDEVFQANIPLTPVMADALTEDENGVDVGYYLAKNPGEAERITKLSPLQQAIELGRLSAKLAQKEAEPDPPAVTKATPPPQPLKKATAAKAVDIYDPEMPFKDFVKERNKQESARKGR